MAGRGGRGRGRTNMTFKLGDLGIGRGEALPPTAVKPTALFPPMTGQAVPLQTGEEVEYMLALKQELRAACKNLPFYIRSAAPRKDVVRYSDKYHAGEPRDNAVEWSPDWCRLPKELCVKARKSQRKAGPLCPPQVKAVKKSIMPKEEVLSKLETLEKEEMASNSADEDEEEEEKTTNKEEEQAEEEELNEEELEEETDYIMSYFDNGEEFDVDSEDNMDEATYS